MAKTKAVKPRKSAVQRAEERERQNTPPAEVETIDAPPQQAEASDSGFSIEDQIDRLTQQVHQMEFGLTEVTQVKEILTYFNEQLDRKTFTNIGGDDMTRLMTKLAILNVNIGQYSADAVMAANMSYGYKKLAYASEWNPTKERLKFGATKAPTVEDIKNELLVNGWDDFKTEMEKKLIADRLIALNKGIDSLLVAIGYRVKMIHQDNVTTRQQSAY